MRIRGRWRGGLLLGAMAACDRPAPSRANDTVEGQAPPPPAAEKQSTVTRWDAKLGSAFLVISATAEQAAVVLPAFDSTSSLDTANVAVRSVLLRRFELYANGQRVGSATAADVLETDVPDDCTSWPIVRLRPIGDSGQRGWVVGIVPDRVKSFATDSLGGLTAADSARLTIEVARVASAAPGDTVPSLRGTPFHVRRAYIVSTPAGSPFVVAEVVRSLNQEATPLQEHLLLIAERDSASGRLHLAYSERTAGLEESLEATELLLAGQTTDGETRFLLLARYIADGVIYALVAAPRGQQWHSQWTSTYAGC